MLRSHLDPRYRASLFRALAAADAQHPQLDRAFSLLADGRRAAEQAQLTELAGQFAQGQTALIDALRATGHFLDWELAFIRLGLSAGDVSASYRYLAQHYARLAAFTAQLRRNAWLPLGVLLITGLGLPLMGYAERSLTPGGALTLVVGTIIGVLAACGCGYWALQRWRGERLGRRAIDCLYGLPAVGELLTQQQSLHYFTGLERGLSAGLPLAQALRLATAALPYSPRRRAFEQVESRVASGGRFSEALRQSGALAGVQIRGTLPMVDPHVGADAGAAQLTALAPRLLAESTRLTLEEGLKRWGHWLPQLTLAAVGLVLLANLLAFE